VDVFVVLLAMLVLKLTSCLKTLLKSTVHRRNSSAQAALIKANAEADYARACGKAEIIRARVELRSITGTADAGGKGKRG
jgi:hypothetical protein